MNIEQSQLLTLKQLAGRLQVSPETLRKHYRLGTIPGVKLGHRTLRFDMPAVIEALRRAAGA